MLKTPLEQLAYIVEKAREFDAETAPVDSDSGSNPSDDNDVAILEATGDNPTSQELVAALNSLDDDQRIEILALMWVGRGDFDREEWRDALAQAREVHNKHETSYLIGTPLLADYLEIGLDLLGYSLEDYEKDRL
jgi:superfamily I DNA/RNA helicase